MIIVAPCLQVDAAAPGPVDVLAASPAAAKAAVFANKFEAVLHEGLPTAITRYLESNGNPNNVDAADVQAFLQGTGSAILLPSLYDHLDCARAATGNASNGTQLDHQSKIYVHAVQDFVHTVEKILRHSCC